MSRRSTRFAAALAAATVLVSLSAAGVLAGEVKGPPRQINNTNDTGALDHARSACAASGLNDYDQLEGQNERQTQTASDSWRYYGLNHGAPGIIVIDGQRFPGACRGNAGG